MWITITRSTCHQLEAAHDNHFKIYDEEMKNVEENKVCKNKGKFLVRLSADQVKSACIELVTKESQPFSLFDYESFKVLTEQIFIGVGMPIINSRNIMHYVSERHDNLQKMIIKACKGKMISIKMDTATILERSVLGVNIQLIDHDKINIYTLAMKELTTRHTGENLKEELENILTEFEITND